MTIQKFENNLFELEVKTENGQSLFNAETVATSLGITQSKNGKEFVRWERVNEYLKNSPQVGKGDFIPEPMVYKLAFKASNALAEKFQDWLAVEVLPAIRKHGGYLTDEKLEEVLTDPDTIIKLATNLKKEREQRLIAEQRVKELQPKANYYDLILKNPSLMPISVIAKNYGMSASKMNKLLHELGIQYKQGKTWLLYSKYQDQGYTHTEMLEVQGTDKLQPSTKWTQKGHLFLYDQLKKRDVYPTIEVLFSKEV